MEKVRQLFSVLLIMGVLVGVLQCSGTRSDLDNPITQGTEKDAPATLDPDQYGDWLKKRVVVFPFINRSTYGHPQVGDYSAKLLTEMLMRTQGFVMVNFSDLGADTNEWMLENDFLRPKVLEIARGSGINGFVIGTIDKVIDKEIGDEVGLVKQKSWLMEVHVRADFIDSRSGRVLGTVSAIGRVEETGMDLFMFSEDQNADQRRLFEASKMKRALYKAFLDVVPMIQKNQKKVDWSGQIARIEGERVFVNAGPLTGLRVGDVLKVMEEGDDVFDPVDGRLIGQSPGRVKGTVKVLHFFGKDGSLAIVTSGSRFQIGDRVELY